MIAWRITSSRYAAMDGAGGLLVDGRWHRRGLPVIYTSSSIALATLEKRVHTQFNMRAQVLIRIEVPDEAVRAVESIATLPGDWAQDRGFTQSLGSKWLEDMVSFALSVPSAVIPLERNLLLNPRHSDFRLSTSDEPIPYRFDERLF